MPLGNIRKTFGYRGGMEREHLPEMCKNFLNENQNLY